VFENREPRRIFGLRRDEVKGRWRKLHNEEVSGFLLEAHVNFYIHYLTFLTASVV
jgi:hypothetical protein